METIKKLYELVSTDANLQAKFNEIVSGFSDSDSDEITAKLVSFAKESGFIITKEDIDQFFNSDESSGQLSDIELDSVAGGKGGVVKDLKRMVKKGKKNVKYIVDHPDSLI